MNNFFLFFLISVITCTSTSFASTFNANLRLTAGGTSVSPSELNTEMSSQSLKQFSVLPQYGLEITQSPIPILEWGLRYSKHYSSQEATTPSTLNNYYGEISQDSVMLLLRFSYFKTTYLRADVFGGYGGINTTFKIKNASQDGSLTKTSGPSWFATPYSAYGTSIAIGNGKYYFVMEAGVETNKISGFTRNNNINSNVNNINLNGTYASVGFLVEGITGTTTK